MQLLLVKLLHRILRSIENDEPPRINKQMRQAKLNLAVDLTIKLRSFDEPRMEDLSAVSDWVLMINTTPAATKMTVGAKRKCAGDEPTNDPIPTPPMPITPSSTSTTTTSTGDPNNFLHSPPSLPMRYNEGNVM